MSRRRILLLTIVTLLTFVLLQLVQAQPQFPLPAAGEPSELLINTGFETDLDHDKVPDQWTAYQLLNAKRDKLKCDATIAHSGTCAFMFRGNLDGSSSNITQKVTDLSGFVYGSTVTFSANVDPRSSTAGMTFGKTVIKFTDGSKTTLKLQLPSPGALLTRATENYVQVMDAQTIQLSGDNSVKSIKVKFQYTAVTGKFLMDDVSLSVSADVDTNTPASTETIEASPTDTVTAEATATSTAVGTEEATPSPTSTELPPPLKLTPSVGTFGWNVLVDGTRLFITGSEGVYVFGYNGTAWVEQQILTPEGNSNPNFGEALSVDGNTLAIGAGSGESTAGKVYIFTCDGSIWSQQTAFTPDDVYTETYFAVDLVLDGNMLLVSAPGDTSSGPSSIRVFLYDGMDWVEQSAIVPNDTASGQEFGYPLAIDGDTLLTGAMGDNSAYVFTRSGNTWTQQQKLTISDPDTWAGRDVALSGNVAMIGATESSLNLQGTVYVFARDGMGIWQPQPPLTSSDGNPGDALGLTIALKGNTALIGSEDHDSAKGAVYQFTFDGLQWIEQQKIMAYDAQNDLYFGEAIDFEAGTAFIGSNDGVYVIPLP